MGIIVFYLLKMFKIVFAASTVDAGVAVQTNSHISTDYKGQYPQQYCTLWSSHCGGTVAKCKNRTGFEDSITQTLKRCTNHVLEVFYRREMTCEVLKIMKKENKLDTELLVQAAKNDKDAYGLFNRIHQIADCAHESVINAGVYDAIYNSADRESEIYKLVDSAVDQLHDEQNNHVTTSADLQGRWFNGPGLAAAVGFAALLAVLINSLGAPAPGTGGTGGASR